MDIKRIIKRGTKRIIQRGANTLGYEISWRRQLPSLECRFFEGSPKLPVLSQEQVDTFANRAIDADYWRRLNPELSIDGVGERSVGLEIEALERKEIERQIGKLRSDGYFQTKPALSSRATDKMRGCVEQLRREGWPATFCFVYDEFWDVVSIPSLTEILTEFLGAEYRLLSDFFTYYVLPHKGARGWSPHADYPQATTSRLTVWIPLSDATVDNSCMYLIPQDRVSSVSDLFNGDYVTVDELRFLLWATKAQPASAGSLLGWNHKIIHWGSIASDSARPRISVGYCFVGAGVKGRIGRRKRFTLDPPYRFSFSQRIGLICETVLGYDHPTREPLDPICKRLVERLEKTVSP